MKSLYCVMLIAYCLPVQGALVRIDRRRLQAQLVLKRAEDAWLERNVPGLEKRWREFCAQRHTARWVLRRYFSRSFGI